MIVGDREIVFTEHFFEQLVNIQTHSSVYSAKQGRQLTTDVIDFVIDVIAPNPYIFVEYEGL